MQLVVALAVAEAEGTAETGVGVAETRGATAMAIMAPTRASMACIMGGGI
jgi:hypothetical protein